MNTRLLYVPNKPAIVGVAGEQAANDASPFAVKRGDEGVEVRAQSAMNRAAALIARMPERNVAKLLPEPVKAVAPVTSRSAALAVGLDSKVKEFTSVRPNESEHLSAFESVNRLIAEAHQEFEQKWAPVADFKARTESYSDNDLRDVIAQAGDPADYEAESEHIKHLALESKSHLAALSDHVAVYSKANGSDSSVQEVSERVQSSLADLAPANPNTAADDETTPGTGYGSGHASGESLADSTKKALKALRGMIERFISMVCNLLGLNRKPA